ncbi:von Willebrand factor type A domain-containing protein [Peptostreptococcus russellii]|uniref:von Willebrand factor type A domain-containing protein n=1 Tax=Peptostreptococcus russellii TaxID=215200 RepID=A0A1H8GQG5_9FIRM|nr:vWA domain-containing protein [Peptostreptococcus russellii]SEN46059.1 von Willebrand factor type A domain-containing protein [Peptostreptococcus russellii]
MKLENTKLLDDNSHLMKDYNKTIEDAKENLEVFLEKNKKNLVSYTLDSSILYLADENAEKFIFRPAKSTLYLPLTVFVEKEISENQILWQIYFSLALYPDWKKNIYLYKNREQSWKKEIESISMYILKEIENAGLENDEAYKRSNIYNYVKEEIMSFLYNIDSFASAIRVGESCPIYRSKYAREEIERYNKKMGKKYEKLKYLPKHRVFSNSFFIKYIYGMDPEIDSKNNPYKNKIFDKDYFDFIEQEFKKIFVNYLGIEKRDEFTKTFIYPYFKDLWIEEIGESNFYSSKEKKEKNTKADSTEKDKYKEANPDDIGINKKEHEEIIEEIYNIKKTEDISNKDLQIDANLSLVNKHENDVFKYYKNISKKERDDMKKVWKMIIGHAQKEKNIKKYMQISGKLDVNSFINRYPDYVEAERKGSYKNLKIFSRYELEKEKNRLPENIEISFLIDNSGSMNSEKIDYARRAITVALLSLEDFSDYIKVHASSMNQKISVETETFFFGSGYKKIKEFNDTRGKKEANIIKSIVKIDGSSGATDDASCLKEINESINLKEENLIKRGKLIKMVFEITDGASGFPGLAKKEVKSMEEKGVLIYGIQIGKVTESSKKTFDYIWNGDEKRGISLGEDIEKLPKTLLKLISKNIEFILNG